MRDWDRFYLWLSSDPDRAASEYMKLRRALISYFNGKFCADSEGLADQTIERVVQLLPRFGDQLPDNPLRFCYGVAFNIYREYLRNEVSRNGGNPSESTHAFFDPLLNDEKEAMDKCLYGCLHKLDKKRREMFLRYYLVSPREKSADHQEMADQMGISLTALRLQIKRIKEKLRNCMKDCKQRGEKNLK